MASATLGSAASPPCRPFARAARPRRRRPPSSRRRRPASRATGTPCPPSSPTAPEVSGYAREVAAAAAARAAALEHAAAMQCPAREGREAASAAPSATSAFCAPSPSRAAWRRPARRRRRRRPRSRLCPLPPGSPRSFSGCSDVCEYSDSSCDDGGLGSVFPQSAISGATVPTAVYGRKQRNTCGGHDGYRQDGGEGSRLSDLLDGSRGALADLERTALTAAHAKSPRTARTRTRRRGRRHRHYPPRPSPPRPPSSPPPPPPDAWDGCLNTCSTARNGLCEDGGLASVAAICTLGTDCEDCGYRVSTTVACSNTCANRATMVRVRRPGAQCAGHVPGELTVPTGVESSPCPTAPGALQQAAAARRRPRPRPRRRRPRPRHRHRLDRRRRHLPRTRPWPSTSASAPGLRRHGRACPTLTPTSDCALTRPRLSTTASRTPCCPL